MVQGTVAAAVHTASGWPDDLSPGVLHRTSSFRAADPHTGHNARAMLTATLADWHLQHLVEDVNICASELVNNAVQHAAQPPLGTAADHWLTLTIRCEERARLFVDVADADPRLPTYPREDDPLAVTGRGLLIISLLADQLSWRRAVHGGKVVTCGFSLKRYGLEAA